MKSVYNIAKIITNVKLTSFIIVNIFLDLGSVFLLLQKVIVATVKNQIRNVMFWKLWNSQLMKVVLIVNYVIPLEIIMVKR